jgi:hypothetical protein
MKYGWSDTCAKIGLTVALTLEPPGAELNADLIGVTGRVKVVAWLYTLLDPVPSAAITSVW